MDWLFPAMKNGVRVRAHVYIQGDEMNKFRGFVRCHKILASLASIGILGAALCGAKLLRAQSASETNAPMSDSALIAEFRRVEVASVSDALEQLTGQRMYMSHRMHPILTAKFAGFARTVLLKAPAFRAPCNSYEARISWERTKEGDNALWGSRDSASVGGLFAQLWQTGERFLP